TSYRPRRRGPEAADRSPDPTGRRTLATAPAARPDFQLFLKMSTSRSRLSPLPGPPPHPIPTMATHRPPPTLDHLPALDAGLLGAVAAGEARLTGAQGLELLRAAPLHVLGRYADARARALHGDR